MAIKFSGEFEVRKYPEEVYDFLTDPNSFGALLSNPKDLTAQDDKHFTVKVRVGILFIQDTAEMQMERTEADRPSRAQYKGHCALAGQNITMVGGFDLTPIPDGETVRTTVKWQGEVEIVGTLASIAVDLLESMGKIWIQKLIDNLQRAMA